MRRASSQSCDEAHLGPNDGKSRAAVRSHLPQHSVRLGFLGADSDSGEFAKLFVVARLDFRRVAHWIVSVHAVIAANFLDELAGWGKKGGEKSICGAAEGSVCETLNS